MRVTSRLAGCLLLFLLFLFIFLENEAPHAHFPPAYLAKTDNSTEWIIERKNRVQHTCTNLSENMAKHSHSSTFRQQLLETHILVDEKKKVLFCAIPKVCSTSWKRKMIGMTGKVNISWILKTPLIRKWTFFHKFGLRFLKEYKPSEVQEIVRTFYKFLFVRHPYDRLISAYKDKLNPRNPHKGYHLTLGRQAIKLFRANATKKSLETGSDVTFTEYVRLLVKMGAKVPYRHMQTYNKLCLPCFIPYDVIGKMETFQRDSQIILNHIWPNISKHWFPGPGHSVGTHVTRRHVYMDMINPSLLIKLREIYKDDFLMFNYT